MASAGSTLIAIRADASVAIGSGHIMRCLALAEALQARGAAVRFLCQSLTPELRGKIAAAGIDISDLDPAADDAAASTRALAGIGAVDVLVVDHYSLDAAWERLMRPAARRIVAIDDLANRPHACALLLDQNYYHDAAQRYRGLVPRDCLQRLGPRYALLRRQFAAADGRPAPSTRTALRRLLVCFGGTDAEDYTASAIAAFVGANLPAVAATVVVGGAYPHWPALEATYGRHDNIRLLRNVADMAALMAQSDLFLGSGGSITWERAAMGLPGITIAIADNQRQLSRELAASGAGLDLDSAELSAEAIGACLRIFQRHPSLLQACSRRIGELCDGRGAARVARELVPAKLHLRRACLADCAAVYSWRNDPATRQHAGNSAALDYASHQAWFARTLDDLARVLLIAEQVAPARPVGVLRYDLQGATAIISAYLVPGLHGTGLGTDLIRAGDDWLAQNHPGVDAVTAEIHADNMASAAAFAAAGYRLASRRFIHHLDGK
ncbi:MAG: UDP-2,4-diacetamido-2,4,6-trideoxy-beta-L-altropyranose hydrolase [Rhodocyclaceae bacterium]|nr:UDP-2,4-diacetamido-2,4,6-trideoxy-beta-L-altropyranose hydrolase [Rhodocyclaceae bacterium]